ncbi:MAG: N-acetylneuraminate synthase family protein [Bacteroidota bacterium]
MDPTVDEIFIVAEVAQAHDGSLGIAHSYIEALKDTGVNAIKFQTHIAEAESSEFEPFRVKFSYEDATRYDYWKRMEFTPEQWQGLKDHCDRVGLEFLSSPFSISAVNLLEKINVKRYKVGSGEVNNFLLLDKICNTGKEVILSSGMSSLQELEDAVAYIRKKGNLLSILQCTTAYPTQPKEWGLNMIGELKQKFNVPVGYSDHSGDIYACLSAATLGARILEFHVVFDKKMFGPDAPASLSIDQVSLLVKGVRQIEQALRSPVEKNDVARFNELKKMFGKSLAVNRSLPKGHVIEISDLESKKPAGKGIHASEYRNVIGKKTNKDIPSYSFLRYEDLE